MFYVIKGQGMYGHVAVEKLKFYHFLIPIALVNRKNEQRVSDLIAEIKSIVMFILFCVSGPSFSASVVHPFLRQ